MISFNRTTCLLQSIAGRNAWDKTMMPSKRWQFSGNGDALEEVIHDRKKNSKVKKLLEEAEPKTTFQKRA